MVTDMDRDMGGENKNEALRSERRTQIITLIAAIVGLLAAVVGLATAYVEYEGKKQAEQQVTQQKSVNEDLLVTNQDLQNKLADLEVKSLPVFLGRYDQHVADLKRTVSRYQETTEGKAQAENEVINSAQAFLDFADRWRKVTKVQGELIDGPLTQLERSVAAHDVAGVIDALRQIERTRDDLKPILEKAIQDLSVQR